jgi:hypothetical protein
MASVQELIDAANAQKSPGISAMEGLARGYLSGQQQSLERAKTLIMLEQNRREQEMRMREQEMMMKNQERLSAQMAAQVDAARKQELKRASSGPEPVTQQMKTKDVWERNEKGQLSLRTEVTPTESNDKKTLESIITEKVISGEISLEDALNMKAQSIPGGVQFVGMQGGAPVLFNRKTETFKTGKLPGAGPLVSGTQTEGQANATLYGDRAEQAHKQIEELSKVVDLSGPKVAVQGKSPNFLKSAPVQQFEQAKRNFINSILRRESGAVISPSEFENGDKQYFEQFGDSDEVIEQKRMNRETAIAGLKNAAGIAPKETLNTPKKAVGRWNPKTGKVEIF